MPVPLVIVVAPALTALVKAALITIAAQLTLELGVKACELYDSMDQAPPSSLPQRGEVGTGPDEAVTKTTEDLVAAMLMMQKQSSNIMFAKRSKDGKPVTGGTQPRPDHTTTKEHKLPDRGKPDSSIDRVNDKGEVITRRYYDKKGEPARDIDFTDHGNPKRHPNVPHEHTWTH